MDYARSPVDRLILASKLLRIGQERSRWTRVRMKTPELIRARHIGGWINQQERLGLSIHRPLEKAGIPVECLTDGDGVLPTVYLARLLSSVCSAGELSALAFNVAPASLAAYPGIERQLTAATSLLDALRRFRLGSTELSGLRIESGDWEHRSWIYAASSSSCLEDLGWNAYLLRPMIEIARAGADPEWLPRTVLLPSNHSTQLAALDLPASVNVEPSSRVVAIEVPREILCAHLQPDRAIGGLQCDEQELPTDLAGALRLLLKTYIGKRPLKITEAAELAGCSVRSLQRELRNANCSFSTLFQEARYLSSMPLLERSSASITDVAYELGYSDPAHFTRAFRRWTGVTPRQFRGRLASGE